MTRPFERISVVGLGYIGLPAAVILASRGVNVISVDSNPQMVVAINNGKIHIKEPMLDIAVHSVVTTGLQITIQIGAPPSHSPSSCDSDFSQS